MSVNLVDREFSADYFLLKEDNQPVCADQFLLGLQVLTTQATSAISNHEVVEEAFKRIQEAKWVHKSSEAKNDVDQKIQEVRQKWVKVCFCGQFRHVPREHLEKNCGPKFHAQYTSKMKEATEPKLELLPPDGVSVDDYDKTIVKAFLDYIQTGTLSEKALNSSILDLLSLAHLHQIEGLITKCTDLLKEQLDDHENLETIWEFANKQNIPQLKFACLSFMQANRDKIYKELKGKYEEALPLVNALFACEIILKQSPSGNIDVRVEIFNKKTVYSIEQLSKLFTIRSLVLSEKRTNKKRLYIDEKLFSFLKEISTTLKDLQELIIWNETPQDQDFLKLKTLFPNLTAYGNDAPFLITFDEVKTYLKNFRNPDEDDRESEKLVLRSLNLTKLSTLDDVQMAEITSQLQELYHIYIKSKRITSVATPKATLIDCRCCTALITLEALKATKIYCEGCTTLTTIEAPEATLIGCNVCTALLTIKAPNANKIHCQGCTALSNIKAPKATKIYCQYCKNLTTIDAPKATKIYYQGCTSLTTIDAPKITEIHCRGCIALTTIKAPKATMINCDGCIALTTIKAPKATEIHCEECKALTTIKAPKASEIYCQQCIALTTIKAPKASEIYCKCCTSLKTIDAPNVTQIYCEGCIVLTAIKAPEVTVIHCQGCTDLTTIKGPEVSEIVCWSCSSLTTLEAPKATKIYCSACTNLTTIDAPKATEIYCKGCTGLKTIDAPKATKIYCNDCEALKTLEAPKATDIDCRGCITLSIIKAPKATEINSKGCTALTTLEAPKATDIHCHGCAALTSLIAPKATKIFCQYCTSLTTLIAPKATEIDCSSCTALTTLVAPEAYKIYCIGCQAQITIEAPKANMIA